MFGNEFFLDGCCFLQAELCLRRMLTKQSEAHLCSTLRLLKEQSLLATATHGMVAREACMHRW